MRVGVSGSRVRERERERSAPARPLRSARVGQ